MKFRLKLNIFESIFKLKIKGYRMHNFHMLALFIVIFGMELL
jgi:hypothetical protein